MSHGSFCSCFLVTRSVSEGQPTVSASIPRSCFGFPVLAVDDTDNYSFEIIVRVSWFVLWLRLVTRSVSEGQPTVSDSIPRSRFGFPVLAVDDMDYY